MIIMYDKSWVKCFFEQHKPIFLDGLLWNLDRGPPDLDSSTLPTELVLLLFMHQSMQLYGSHKIHTVLHKMKHLSKKMSTYAVILDNDHHSIPQLLLLKDLKVAFESDA